MKFKIEQVAICPPNAEKAIALLKMLGAESWHSDHVVANGKVYDAEPCTNEADLNFNYEMLAGNELEVLDYTSGKNWMTEHPYSVSHFGMHCSAEELIEWRAKFEELGISVAQEVFTESHTNPVIAGKRSYNYVIFDTRAILGVDLKFIVRIDK